MQETQLEGLMEKDLKINFFARWLFNKTEIELKRENLIC